MGLANVTKIHTPPSAERYFPLTPLVSMRCTKTISRPGSGELSKVIADIKTAAQDCCSFVVRQQKHATWSNSCRP